MKLQTKIAAVMIAVVALGAIAGFALWQRGEDQDAALYGNVDIREVSLAFRQSGRVEKIFADEGDSVREGQTLATLDASTYRDALNAAIAQRDEARAQLDKLEAGSRPQEIEAARQKTLEAAALLKQREDEWSRQQKMFAQGDTSKKAFDAAQTMRDAAKAALAAAEQNFSLVKQGPRVEDIEAAKTALEAAVAKVAIAQTALNDCVLKSPADAVVLSRVREAGSMVDAQAPVFTLSLRHPMYVRAYLAEPQLSEFKQGQQVLIHADGNVKTYHGKIGFVSPRAEFAPKSVQTPDLRTDLVYRIRITVSDDDDALKQGMPVTITKATLNDER